MTESRKITFWFFVALAILSVVAFVRVKSRPPDHPCSSIPKPPAYLYDLSAYREHRLQDELDEVDLRGGDEFDKDAARSRVLAMPDARLDKERRGELDFVTKIYNDTARNCSD